MTRYHETGEERAAMKAVDAAQAVYDEAVKAANLAGVRLGDAKDRFNKGLPTFVDRDRFL